jgi:hypothetical protein
VDPAAAAALALEEDDPELRDPGLEEAEELEDLEETCPGIVGYPMSILSPRRS